MRTVLVALALILSPLVAGCGDSSSPEESLVRCEWVEKDQSFRPPDDSDSSKCFTPQEEWDEKMVTVEP